MSDEKSLEEQLSELQEEQETDQQEEQLAIEQVRRTQENIAKDEEFLKADAKAERERFLKANPIS